MTEQERQERASWTVEAFRSFAVWLNPTTKEHADQLFGAHLFAVRQIQWLAPLDSAGFIYQIATIFGEHNKNRNVTNPQ